MGHACPVFLKSDHLTLAFKDSHRLLSLPCKNILPRSDKRPTLWQNRVCFEHLCAHILLPRSPCFTCRLRRATAPSGPLEMETLGSQGASQQWWPALRSTHTLVPCLRCCCFHDFCSLLWLPCSIYEPLCPYFRGYCQHLAPQVKLSLTRKVLPTSFP